MRLGRHRDENGHTTPVALETTGERVRCGACGGDNTASDTFCSQCGAKLSRTPPRLFVRADLTEVDSPTVVGPSRVPPPAGKALPSTSAPSRRSKVVVVSLGVGLAAAVAGTLVFALLWHGAAGHATRLQRSLDATRATLATTRSKLTTTSAELRSTTALAEKRRAVLIQAQSVLTSVNPLLSSVDAIQNQSGNLQTDGVTLSGDANSLVGDLATALDYFANTDIYSFDVTYYGSLIDSANSDFAAMQSDETAFAADEAGDGTASTKFGNHADAFSEAVLELQRQLKGVVKE